MTAPQAARSVPHWLGGISIMGVLGMAVAWGQTVEKVEQLEQRQVTLQQVQQTQADLRVIVEGLSRRADAQDIAIGDLKDSSRDANQKLDIILRKLQ